MTAEQPKCSCGSTQAGLIFIRDNAGRSCSAGSSKYGRFVQGTGQGFALASVCF